MRRKSQGSSFQASKDSAKIRCSSSHTPTGGAVRLGKKQPLMVSIETHMLLHGLESL